MYTDQNIKKLSRDEYKNMLDRGIQFRNWSLYEPQNNPSKTYYIVDLGKGLTANKTINNRRVK